MIIIIIIYIIIGVAGFYQSMKDSGAETVIFDTQELGPSRRKKWAFERANFQFFDIDGNQVAYGKYA